ncbi:Myosin light chain kinase, smooth muscle [Hypsibius exemplaris]|uniref:Myosin light chain kinase, smooth muscle n=1 Tax=Hypsibius exemplaris TaxID=2072580 RepID=A0A1W0WW92_HYPEX|nr:Myosin light chain kinase, smooth muscle [Hypsibius exemplaris]
MDSLDPSDNETDVSESSTCSRGHVHRQHRQRVYDFSEDELEDDDEPPLEPRDVRINRDRRVGSFYDLLEILGKGKFGVVYKCMEKATSRYFAAKFIDIKHPQERKEVETEIELMNDLRHPRLLQLYDAFDDGKRMAIIMELASGGELFSRVIDEEFVLTEKVCTVFMRQICEGVEYMHHQNVVHLDLKPENVLCVTPTGNRIKLIDFGLARRYSAKENIRVMFGTPEFVAPEVIGYDRISLATDMWSVGVICYILLSGLSPFMGDNDTETLSNVTNAAWDFEDECFDAISDDAKDFITQLLVKRPEKRITASQSLKHRWLKQSRRRSSILDPEDKSLSKAKLRRFVIRRRWQKVFNTIRALRRMGSFRLDSATSPTGQHDDSKPMDLVLAAGGVPDAIEEETEEPPMFVFPIIKKVDEGPATPRASPPIEAVSVKVTSPLPDGAPQIGELVHNGVRDVSPTLSDDPAEEEELDNSLSDRTDSERSNNSVRLLTVNSAEGSRQKSLEKSPSPTECRQRTPDAKKSPSPFLEDRKPRFPSPVEKTQRGSEPKKSPSPMREDRTEKSPSIAEEELRDQVQKRSPSPIPEGGTQKTSLSTENQQRTLQVKNSPSPVPEDRTQKSPSVAAEDKLRTADVKKSPSPKPEFRSQNSMQFQDSRRKFEEAQQSRGSSFSKSPSPAGSGRGSGGTVSHSSSTSSFRMQKSCSPETSSVVETVQTSNSRTTTTSRSVSHSSSSSPSIAKRTPPPANFSVFQKSPSPLGNKSAANSLPTTGTPPRPVRSLIKDIDIPIQILDDCGKEVDDAEPTTRRPRSTADSGAEDMLGTPGSTPSTPDALDDDDASEMSGLDEAMEHPTDNSIETVVAAKEGKVSAPADARSGKAAGERVIPIQIL